jgi:hypothetical protein
MASINRKRLAKRAGIGLLAVLVLAITSDVALALCQRWQAGRLLLLMKQIQVGKTTEAEFHRLVENDLRFTGMSMERDANGSVTSFSYTLYNRALIYPGRLSADFSRMEFRNFPYWMLFGVGVSFEQGSLVKKNAIFFTPGVGHPEFAVSINEERRGFGFESKVAPNDYPHHIVRYQTWGEAAWRRIWVRDDDEASDADRRGDWNLDLNCMLRFGGCQDSRAILPGVIPTPLTK